MEGILVIISSLIGYALGRYNRPEEKIARLLDELPKKKGRPKPGVVNALTEEEIRDKHDPIKKGDREAFDRLFREHPELLAEEK